VPIGIGGIKSEDGEQGTPFFEYYLGTTLPSDKYVWSNNAETQIKAVLC
jgi:hypothetical protein